MSSNRSIPQSCVYCNDTFFVYPHEAKKQSRKYCSHSCRNKDSATGRYVSRGYVYLYRPDHPDSNVRGWIAEHRLIAEAKLGRQLHRTEVVHHSDGNPQNNDPSNLYVMTFNEHAALHFKGNQYGRIDGWAKRYSECTVCHTTHHPHAARGMCEPCYRHDRFVRTGG